MATILTASARQANTKGELRRLRNQGMVPISIQHRGDKTLHLQEEAKPLDEFIRQYGESSLLQLDVVDQERYTVLVHEVQRDALTRRLLHVTFQSVVRGESIKVHVPLVFQGEPEAVRTHNGVIQHQTEQVEIRCLPGNLPDHITVDISHLTFGESLRVADLPRSERYEILTSPDHVVASLSHLAASEPEPVAEEAVPEAAPEA